MPPNTRLSIPLSLWLDLTRELHRRTEGVHESGTFILGHKSESGRHGTTLMYYDELDSKAYANGVCILHADAFGHLWQRCSDLGLVVVADAHVHCLAASQSRADRENPMVARAGHLAIILPYLAQPPVNRRAVGLYEYLGNYQWRTHDARQGAGVLNVEDEG